MSNRSLFRYLASTNRIQKASRLIRDQLKVKTLKHLNYCLFQSFVAKFSANFSRFRPIKLLPLAVLMAASAQEADLIKQVDELYDENKFDEVEKLLNNPDLLEKSDKKFEFKWRLARARYGQVKEKQRNESELDAIRDLVLSSLQDNPECGPAHKVWSLRHSNRDWSVISRWLMLLADSSNLIRRNTFELKFESELIQLSSHQTRSGQPF